MLPIKSPYQDDLDKLSEDRSYFDFYDDLPASTAWMHTIGAALGKAFSVSVNPSGEEWEIDHTKKEMSCGSIENIYTRRGVLGLLLNGIGRLALSIKFPQTTKEAQAFAKKHDVEPKLAKHFGALSRFIDEVRTDDQMAHKYAGGARVVDTMHAQAYEGATEGLRMMALDMRVRKELARETLSWFAEFMSIVEQISKLPQDDTSSAKLQVLQKNAAEHIGKSQTDKKLAAALAQAIWSSNIGASFRANKVVAAAGGRPYAVVLIALYPENTDIVCKVLVRAYDRNIAILGRTVSFTKVSVPEEKIVIQAASKIHQDVDEVKQLASHSGGHAQYVLAKAEQYYHAATLGIQVITPFFGYDMEAKALDVEAANEAAWKISQEMVGKMFTVDVDMSIDFAKELLPIIAQYPFLDLNDRQKNEKTGKSSSMGQRVAGAGKGAPPKGKRKKEREKRSEGDRAMDKRKLDNINNKKNQEKIDEARNGYSIFDTPNQDPLNLYAYIIGPYLGRISATAAKMRRILKVNDPLGLRGAFRRGKALNAKVLYRHRLDDYKLFAKKEVDKDVNYGFALTGDLSGSTEVRYTNQNNRLVQDEMLAAAFVIAEVAERIGEKVMCAISFFTDDAISIKRAGFYLNRSKIMRAIKDHGGGTNVAAAGEALAEDLQELEDFKVKNKTVVFITDGGFSAREFLNTVKAAKKFNASIAYFQICENVQQGINMCKEVENFVAVNAKGVRIRTRNITTSGIDRLPEAIAQLMKETIGIRT